MPGASTRPPSAGTPEPVDADAARAAVTRFLDASPETRGCAVIGPSGLLAATGDRERWGAAAAELLEAADGAAGTPAAHAHVATEEGEAYAVRLGDLAMVAVTDRFTLSSLVLADMRAELRELLAMAPVAREAAA